MLNHFFERYEGIIFISIERYYALLLISISLEKKDIFILIFQRILEKDIVT